MLLTMLRGELPAAAAAKARAALRDLGPVDDDQPDDNLDRRQARDELCEQAINGDREAVSAVTDAGYLPSGKELRLPFLFLTEQWDRYDREDPHGQKLRAYLRRTPHSKLEVGRRKLCHDDFRRAAERAGRPDPWPPSPPPGRRADGAAGSHSGSYHSSYGDISGGFSGGFSF